MRLNQTDFGKLRANALADGDNMIRVPDCDTPGTVCQDTVTFALTTGDYVTGFVYTDGTTTTTVTGLSILLSVANIDTIKTAIFNTINVYEVDPQILITESSGSYTITHTGAGTLSSITVTAGAQSFSRNCTTSEVCDFYGLANGTITLGDGATDNAMDNNPHTYDTVTPSNNAGIAAALKTDLDTEMTALGLTGTVAVAVNDVAQQFAVTITASISYGLYLTGVQMTKQNCRVVFS